jgi:hypothetical protein
MKSTLLKALIEVYPEVKWKKKVAKFQGKEEKLKLKFNYLLFI